MRRGVFVCLLVCAVPFFAHAIFYNNTETIEVGDGVPPEPPGWSGGVNTNNPGSGSSGGSGAAGGSGATTPIPTTTPPTNPDTSQGTGTGSNSGSNSSSGPANEETIWNALFTGGALFGSFGEGGILGSGGINFEGGFVRIVASRVRDIFRDNSSFSEFLTFWKRGTGASARERGLIAASTAVRDANFEEATFTATRVDIIYRSRGYLIGFIPWSFPVRVSIIPAATSLEERVTVKLPWYRWFLRTFFSRANLAREIDEALQAAYSVADPNDDLAAVTFEAATEYLRQKVGTISNSILRGA